MPVEEPNFGEVWTTSDVTSGRLMQGIVADVSPTRVLFVSLAGNRVAVPLSRLRTNWNFVQPAPRRSLPPCERVGCSYGGMIEYARSDRILRACPKHVPFGVQCHITQNYQPSPETRNIRPGFECRSIPCPSCGDRDPAEDIRIAVFPARFWLCTSCNSRWVTVPRVPDEEQDVEHLSYVIAHELGRLTFEVDSILVVDPTTWDELARSPTTERDPREAISCMRIRGMQAFLDTSDISELHREFFRTIMRVRSNAVRQVDRPVQRLGGSPNRGGIVGSPANPVRLPPAGVLPIPENPVIYGPGGTNANAVADTLRRLRQEEQRPAPPRDLFEAASSESPIPDVLIEKESVWVQRRSGDLMVVLDIIQAQDGSEAISFRRSHAEDIEPSVTMSRRDFLEYHRPYVAANSTEAAARPAPMLNVSIDEEWECQDGSGMIITQVDFRKEIVYGDDLKNKRHRQIPFVQFTTGRWRKIIRRSIYERIRQPEVNLSAAKTTEDDG